MENSEMLENVDDMENPDEYFETERNTESTSNSEKPESNSRNLVKKPSVKQQDNKFIQVPISRIKGIMKLDSDFISISLEGAFTMGKATELFIQSLAKAAFSETKHNKKTLQKQDIESAINSVDALCFLEECL